MPITTFDFRAPLQRSLMPTPDYSAIQNLLPNILQSYHAPIAMRQQRQMGEEKIKADQFANLLNELYGKREKEAEIASKEAYAQHYANPLSATGRDLMSIYGGNTDQFQKALKRAHGIYEPEDFTSGAAFGIEGDTELQGIPPEVLGTSFQNMPKQRQNEAARRMHNDLRSAESLTETIPTIDKMSKMMRENPNLYKSFAAIMDKPNDSVFVEAIKSRLPEKERTAVDLFGKYAADLVLKGGQSWGGGRQTFTDARQALLQQRKPEVRKTGAANIEVLNEMKKEAIGSNEYAKALRFGLKRGIDILPNSKVFRDIAESTQEREPVRLGITTQEGDKVLGSFKGKRVMIPKDKVDAFKKDGGIIYGE